MAEKMKELHSTLKSVPLAKMKVSNPAQRELRPLRVQTLLEEFDLEMLGYPVVNLRDGTYWIIDGQHRVEALKIWLDTGWEKQSVTCRAYSGQTEAWEADMFDRLNNTLAVGAYDKFKVRCAAGRETETSVRKIVEKSGLHIARNKNEGSISAVSTLVRVYKRTDGPTLARTLRLVYQSFGDPGLMDKIIDGVARVCTRYNGKLNDEEAIDRLSNLRGGVGAVVSRAELLRKQTGAAIPECVAAATVDMLNGRHGGKKLPPWWRT